MSELKKLLLDYVNDMNTTNYKKVESYLLNNTNLNCKNKIKKVIVISILELNL